MKAQAVHYFWGILLLLCASAWSPEAAWADRMPPLAQTTPTLPVTPPFTPLRYTAQSGDTLAAVAAHFHLATDEILSTEPLSETGLLSPGQILLLPARRQPTMAPLHALPDREVIDGPSAARFDTAFFLQQAGGLMSTHREYLNSTAWTPAAQIIDRVAVENSINPRLLLALLEFECHCVYTHPAEQPQDNAWLGVPDYHYPGLYGQLSWAANQLSIGYYGWRRGDLSATSLADGIITTPTPGSNAGSVALLNYFAARAAVGHPDKNPETSRDLQVQSRLQEFVALHRSMYGDTWEQARQDPLLLPAGLRQPVLILPFEAGRLWSFSSGPHKAWLTEGALAALDFAPASLQGGCQPTDAWVIAAADGLVVRSELGAVIQDLDGDGLEQTGWAILYMHIETATRVPVGTYLHAGERIGHPSCEGGPATGTNLHIARKYNGEWIAADGPVPFILDGWTAHAGARPYEGSLTQAGQTVIAHPYGSADTLLSRKLAGLSVRLLLPLMMTTDHHAR